MIKDRMGHENCHSSEEKPNEGEKVAVYLKDRINDEVTIGYCANEKWYIDGGSEVNKDQILCWHHSR